MRKIEPETWNRLIAVGGEVGSREWRKEGEGISQKTCMNDSWTWTAERGLTVGERGGLGRVGERKKY